MFNRINFIRILLIFSITPLFAMENEDPETKDFTDFFKSLIENEEHQSRMIDFVQFMIELEISDESKKIKNPSAYLLSEDLYSGESFCLTIRMVTKYLHEGILDLSAYHPRNIPPAIKHLKGINQLILDASRLNPIHQQNLACLKNLHQLDEINIRKHEYVMGEKAIENEVILKKIGIQQLINDSIKRVHEEAFKSYVGIKRIMPTLLIPLPPELQYSITNLAINMIELDEEI